MLLRSPEESLSRIIANLYFERVRIKFIRRLLTPEDIAIVRNEGNVPAGTPDSAIYPEALILRLADRQGWSQNRAIAEVGRGLEMISDADYRELCEDLGEELTAEPPNEAVVEVKPAQTLVPSFSSTCVLTYRGRRLKYYSRPGGNTAIQVLRGFDDAGWTEEIPFPIAGATGEEMHEIRRRLNERTSKIGLGFSVDVHRRVISWRLVDETTSE